MRLEEPDEKDACGPTPTAQSSLDDAEAKRAAEIIQVGAPVMESTLKLTTRGAPFEVTGHGES